MNAAHFCFTQLKRYQNPFLLHRGLILYFAHSDWHYILNEFSMFNCAIFTDRNHYTVYAGKSLWVSNRKGNHMIYARWVRTYFKSSSVNDTQHWWTDKLPHIESEHVCGKQTWVRQKQVLPCEEYIIVVADSVYYLIAQTRICLIDNFWSGHWTKKCWVE